MSEVRIDRLRARYHLPATLMAEQDRLRRVTSEAFDDVLEAALDRAGFAASGEICIRSVRVVARLRLSEPDSILALRFGMALAAQINAAASDTSRDVVHYRSRAQALTDLVIGCGSGDLDRSWAWRQLGLWKGSAAPSTAEAIEQAMRVLAVEAELGVAVLAHVMSVAPHLAPSILGTAPPLWHQLTSAALIAAGSDPELSMSGPMGSAVPLPLTQAARIAQRSAIARALLPSLNSNAPAPSTILRSLAIVAILEVEPAVLRGGGEPARALIGAVEELLEMRTSGRAPTSQVTQPSIPQRSTQAAIESGKRQPRHYTAPSTGSESHIDTPQPRIGTQPPEDSNEHHRADAGGPAPTQAAGLVFLLHLAEPAGLPDALLADHRLARRGLRWCLHLLALSLAPLQHCDPAALVFAGLRPGAEPPSSLEEPPGEDELQAIAGVRGRVVRALSVRLSGLKLSEEALLDFVCRRRGEIVTDPGWIEIRLALDEVSTAIRAAGLDLDPGWIPWLGVVMRFVYV